MKRSNELYDIAVFSGGFCGFCAAVKLAQAGNRVILVERRPVLGWEGTWAFQLDMKETKSSVGQQIISQLEAAGGKVGTRIDAPILEMVLDRQAEAAGVEILFYSQPVAVSAEGETATAIIVSGKSGEFVIRAKAFVDATENALLWRKTGVSFREPQRADSVHVLFLNGVKMPLSAPQPLGDIGGVTNVVIKPSVWNGEVAVEFEIPSSDVCVARRSLPYLLEALRKEQPELSNALVTHVGIEPFPLSVSKSESRSSSAEFVHPKLRNLFGVGLWTANVERSNEPLQRLAQRFEIGELCGEQIAEAIYDLPQPDGEHTIEQSVVAPPVFSRDVIVCGGGTAGAIAAIASARQGVKTTLIDAATFLGGIGTGGGIHSYYHGVTGGIQDEVDERLNMMSLLFGPPDGVSGFHPEAKKVVLQQMADEAGVELVFSTFVTGAETDEVASRLPATGNEERVHRIRGVVAAGPNGNAVYHAKVIVDSTGDGDVAAMAGAPFTFGRETDNLPHAYSQAAGRLDKNGHMLITNFDAGYCDPTDVADLTRARRHGLMHYWRDTFTPENRLLYIAPLIGLRSSRQVVGDYALTFSDEIVGREFPDVIAYARSHFDNHGFDYENESDEAMLWVWLLGNWSRPIGCEIPYRCLLPRGVDGLLMACRAISITHDAHNQLRMQRDMQRLGEAAGVAAAMSAKQDIVPRALDVSQLQSALFKSGALGPRRPRELPAPAEAEKLYHDSSWLPPQLPARPVNEWAQELGGEKTRDAAWQLIRAGEEALPLLRNALKSENQETRFWASVSLAMLRQNDAAPELLTCVRERRSNLPEGRKTAEMWKSAIVLLGRLGDKSAVPTLTEVLKDKDADLDTLIAAVRALARIGDQSAVPAIEELLTRKDLATDRELQVSVAVGGSVIEDARWQLELAAAEALARLGSPRPDIVERYQQDSRAYVRRYADKLARTDAS